MAHYTKQQFDKLFNNDDIKRYSAREIENSIYAKQSFALYMKTLANTAKNVRLQTIPVEMSVVANTMRWVASHRFLNGVPYVPHFYLDLGYALNVISDKDNDYLQWWYRKEDILFPYFDITPYKGMRFHDFLVTYHGCDWSKIVGNMRPFTVMNKNLKPILR